MANKTSPEIVMIQPKTSLTGSFIRMLPIGILYASSRVVKEGGKVSILDTRIDYTAWKRDIKNLMTDNTIIVGISVMSGISILESLKISRYIKKNYPGISIVWGGPHPTFSPEDVLHEPAIDYIIRGYGAEPFYQLYLHLTANPAALPIEKIKGLSWRNNTGVVHHNGIERSFEFIHYNDIPYHLIKDLSAYRHVDGEVVFPLYSVMGCPYRCAFCSSPAQYSKFEKRWVPYPVGDVAAHIKMVKESYGATYIYFIDDDSFVDLRHVEAIIDEIKRRGIKVKLGFRGARVNELFMMSDEFLEKLVDAGTNSMHIGAESGSDRMLKFMKKNITASQTLEVNRKLARHPRIRAFYNFMAGFPTETLEETKLTRDLILQLIRDNPSCIVIPLNKPRPLPGTEMYDLAVEHGYIPPKSLEEWGMYELESSDYNPTWLNMEHNKFIRMMFLCMYFIDNKIFKFSLKRNLRAYALELIAILYKPIALFRFKHGLYKLLIEDRIYSFLKWLS